jgi:hypothetical protein
MSHLPLDRSSSRGPEKELRGAILVGLPWATVTVAELDGGPSTLFVITLGLAFRVCRQGAGHPRVFDFAGQVGHEQLSLFLEIWMTLQVKVPRKAATAMPPEESLVCPVAPTGRCRNDYGRVRWAEATIKGDHMGTGTLLLIVLIVLLIGSTPRWSHSRNWGYGPSGVLGLVLIIVVLMVLSGRL